VTNCTWATWQTAQKPVGTRGHTALSYFKSHIELRGDFGCWMWTGPLSGGYGEMPTRGGRMRAYRFSYLIHIGEVPDGLDLDHLCRVPRCVNPWHLDPVTRSVNSQRSRGYNRFMKRGRRTPVKAAA
jgi:hypothetical protein